MLTILEQLTIYLFFVLQVLLDTYCYWKLQMIQLVGEDLTDEEIPLWGMPQQLQEPIIVSGGVEHDEYKVSNIGKEEERFFESLFKVIDEDCTQQDIIHHNTFVQEEEEPAFIMTPEPTVQKSQIKDYLMGEQFWTVEVVGEEQGYIHVSDGTARAWINTSSFGQFFKGDILSMVVIREKESVAAKFVELLQRRSEDFVIYDDDIEFGFLEMEETA